MRLTVFAFKFFVVVTAVQSNLKQLVVLKAELLPNFGHDYVAINELVTELV